MVELGSEDVPTAGEGHAAGRGDRHFDPALGQSACPRDPRPNPFPNMWRSNHHVQSSVSNVQRMVACHLPVDIHVELRDVTATCGKLLLQLANLSNYIESA